MPIRGPTSFPCPRGRKLLHQRLPFSEEVLRLLQKQDMGLGLAKNLSHSYKVNQWTGSLETYEENLFENKTKQKSLPQENNGY